MLWTRTELLWRRKEQLLPLDKVLILPLWCWLLSSWSTGEEPLEQLEKRLVGEHRLSIGTGFLKTAGRFTQGAWRKWRSPTLKWKLRRSSFGLILK